MTPQCPSCGQPLSLGAVFCGQCGARVNGKTPTARKPAPSTASKIFSGSEYVIEKKTLLATRLTSFEFKDASGNLVARARREIVPFGAAFVVETPDGVRVGELRGAVAVIPNRPFLEIRDEQGNALAIIMMRVAKKPGAGFLSIGITTWLIVTPSGDAIAKIDWMKGGHECRIEAMDGTPIAEVHWNWLEIPRDTYSVKILNPLIDPYFVLATIFSNTADRANVA